MSENYKHSNITKLIIKAYYNVYNTLGYGFLEKVYERALLIELNEMGVKARSQMPIKVYYNEQEVGNYFADIVVEESVIVELKASECLCEEDEAQLINYLRATTIEVGVLLNFGKTAQFKRKVFSNTFKQTQNLIKS
jgi:GxxExxY protein